MIMEFLLPSWWEVQVAVVAASFVILCCWFFNLSEDEVVDYRPPVGGSGIVSSDVINEKVDDDPACRDSLCTYFVDGTVKRRSSNYFCLCNQG